MMLNPNVLSDIKTIIHTARDKAIRAVDTERDSLEPEFGTGYSKRQVELFRQFYRVFPTANALHSQLTWTQLRLLLCLFNFFKAFVFNTLNRTNQNIKNTMVWIIKIVLTSPPVYPTARLIKLTGSVMNKIKTPNIL
ncbi:hypothetical protein [Pedobacter nyackensis]|uniref:hypothetical protein n=1 Tax=Pedobacter nyackensis TaxID=475255 RepID=UPI00293113FD|nr:hypothetical protein [Pedobacter nyackensis]